MAARVSEASEADFLFKRPYHKFVLGKSEFEVRAPPTRAKTHRAPSARRSSPRVRAS